MQIAPLPLSADLHTWRGSSSVVCVQSPQKDLNLHSWGLDEALDGHVGDRDTIFVLSLCLFSLSGSLHYISLAALCAERWLLDMVFIPRGLLYCRKLRQKISKLILKQKL